MNFFDFWIAFFLCTHTLFALDSFFVLLKFLLHLYIVFTTKPVFLFSIFFRKQLSTLSNVPSYDYDFKQSYVQIDTESVVSKELKDGKEVAAAAASNSHWFYVYMNVYNRKTVTPFERIFADCLTFTKYSCVHIVRYIRIQMAFMYVVYIMYCIIQLILP